RRDVEVLHHAGQVAEADVDELHVVVADVAEELFWAGKHEGVPLGRYEAEAMARALCHGWHRRRCRHRGYLGETLSAVSCLSVNQMFRACYLQCPFRPSVDRTHCS